MNLLRITAGPYSFTARFEDADAPRTCAKFRTLLLGALKAHWGLRKRNLLEGYLSRFAVCYSDDQLCTRWAEVKHESNQKGQPMSSQDAWIAATALYLDAPPPAHFMAFVMKA